MIPSVTSPPVRLGGFVSAGVGLIGLVCAVWFFWDVLPWFFATGAWRKSASNLGVYLVALAAPAVLAGVGIWLAAGRWRGSRGAVTLAWGLWVFAQLLCGIRCALVFGFQLPGPAEWPIHIPVAIAVVFTAAGIAAVQRMGRREWGMS